MPPSAYVVRALSAMVVLACVAVPIGLAVRWWPSPVSERFSTPVAQFGDRQLAAFKSFALSADPAGPIILSYHDIAPDDGSDRSPYTVTPELLEEQIAMLSASGFTSVTSEQMSGFLTGERLPPRSVWITFDDGAKGTWQYADRILERYGMSATAFVITADVGTRQPYYLTWEEMRHMRDSGRWEFGGHTDDGHHRIASGPRQGDVGPFLLTREWLDPENRLETIGEWRSRVTADLDRSIDALVDHGFSRPLFFAHPFAAVTEPTNDAAIPGELAALVAARFEASVENDPAATPVSADQVGNRHLLRVAVRGDTSTDVLFEQLQAISAASPAN
jgi:poly-beta-1,6-N-acetyl-D-glucosamine N-deacetylase